MLVYEKNNKLNINFNNEVSEQPDLQISKEDGKTSITVDGQPGGGGSSVMLVGVNEDSDQFILDKTWKEIYDALMSGTPVYVKYASQSGSDVICTVWQVQYAFTEGGNYDVELAYGDDPPMPINFTASSENGYPVGTI